MVAAVKLKGELTVLGDNWRNKTNIKKNPGVEEKEEEANQ